MTVFIPIETPAVSMQVTLQKTPHVSPISSFTDFSPAKNGGIEEECFNSIIEGRVMSAESTVFATRYSHQTASRMRETPGFIKPKNYSQ
jgi:hypothetical protein